MALGHVSNRPCLFWTINRVDCFIIWKSKRTSAQCDCGEVTHKTDIGQLDRDWRVFVKLVMKQNDKAIFHLISLRQLVPFVQYTTLVSTLRVVQS